MIEIERLMDHLMADLDAVRASAQALANVHPGLSPRQLTEKAIHSAKRYAAGAGAATGAAASPLTMAPAALIDMAAVLKIESNMVGLIAALIDPKSLENRELLRADITSVIFPAAASQALRQIGIRATEKLTQAAVRKYLTEDAFRRLARIIAAFLGRQITRDAIMLKAVPLVGIGVGAGWNWLEVQAIGHRAVRYFSHEPISTESRSTKLRKLLGLSNSTVATSVEEDEAEPSSSGAASDPDVTSQG